VGSLFQIRDLETVVPFENLHCLVSADPHDGQVIDPCSPHVCQRRVAEIVEPESINLRPSACCVEGGLDGLKGLAPHQEDMRFLQVADLIQGPQESRQLRSHWDKPPLVPRVLPRFCGHLTYGPSWARRGCHGSTPEVFSRGQARSGGHARRTGGPVSQIAADWVWGPMCWDDGGGSYAASPSRPLWATGALGMKS